MAQRPAQILQHPMIGSRCGKLLAAISSLSASGDFYEGDQCTWPCYTVMQSSWLCWGLVSPHGTSHESNADLAAGFKPFSKGNLILSTHCVGVLRECSKEHSSVGATCFRDAGEGPAERAHGLGAGAGCTRPLAVQVIQNQALHGQLLDHSVCHGHAQGTKLIVHACRAQPYIASQCT